MDFISFSMNVLFLLQIQPRQPQCTWLSRYPCLLWYATVFQSFLVFLDLGSPRSIDQVWCSMDLPVVFQNTVAWSSKFLERIPQRWSALFVPSGVCDTTWHHWWYQPSSFGHSGVCRASPVYSICPIPWPVWSLKQSLCIFLTWYPTHSWERWWWNSTSYIYYL